MISYEINIGYNDNKEGVKCMVCNNCYFKDKFNYQPMLVMNVMIFNDCNGFK